MPTPKITDEALRESVALVVANGGVISAAAVVGGISAKTLQSRIDEARRRGIPTPFGPSWHDATARVYARERHIDLTDGVAVVFSDAHYWPGPASCAHRALLEVIPAVRPRLVVANGDILDGARISKHAPHGYGWRPTVKEELDVCKERLNEVRIAARPARTECAFEYTIGNHDERFGKFLAAHAKDYGGLDGFRLEDHFPDWDFAWSLWLNRGSVHPVMVKHRYANGVHAGWNNAMKAGVTTVTGHTHTLEAKPYSDYRGRRWGIQTGCLADPHGPQFEYAENSPTQACAGFAVLTFKDGNLKPPELCEVIDGQAWFRGEIVAEDEREKVAA